MMFSKTKQVLFHLQHSLQCMRCKDSSKELLSHGHCEHWFCRSCAESNAGYPCTVCEMPSAASEMHVNLQLSNVASLCSSLFSLLNGHASSDREGLESCVSPKDDNDFEAFGKSNGAAESGRCNLFLSRSQKTGQLKGLEATLTSGAPIEMCDETHESAVSRKNHRVQKNEELSSDTNVFENVKKDALRLDEMRPSASGHAGREKKMSTKVVKRKTDNINRTSSSGLCEGEELVGKTKVKERSSKPRRSVSKILDRLSLSEVVTPEPKKRRSESSLIIPDDGEEVGKAEKVTISGNQKSKSKLNSEKRSTPKQRMMPQSSKKSSGVKNASNSNLELNLAHTKITPQSGKKRPSANAEKTNLCKRNAKGETPLQVATIKMNIDEVKRLLDAGANPNVKDNAGWTPLHEAVGHGKADIASLLIANGASVNAPGLDNETPLHDAVINQHVECVRVLVANGASVYSRNVDGNTPMDLAHQEEIKALLLDASKAFTASNMDLPLLDESTKLLCFTGSCLSKEENKLLIQYARCLQAKIVDDVTPEVTHLITSVNGDGSCTRTLTYLSGILTGKWIVGLQWLDACCKNESRVSEQEFQVSGCVSHPNAGAPKKAIENRLKQLPPLFDGCQVFFYGRFESPSLRKEQLVALIKRGGGVVLKREPHLHNLDDYPYTHPYHAQNSSSLADCTIYVIYDDTCPNPPSVEAQRMSCLPASWLLDSIATFSFMEKNKYVKP